MSTQSSKWRVVDADGKVHEAPTPRQLQHGEHPLYECSPAKGRAGWGQMPWHAVAQWADRNGLDVREVVPPNQPTRAEAIAAAVTHAAEAARLLERERCAGWADLTESKGQAARDSMGPSYGNGYDCARTVQYWRAVTTESAGKELAQHIRSGEPVPQ